MSAGVQLEQIADGKLLPPNLLVNPGFEIWQRGAGPFTTTDGFSADEWALKGGTGQSVSRSASPKSGVYGLSYTNTSGAARSLNQGVEAYKSLEGLYVTFSVWVNCATASMARAFITDYVAAQESVVSGYHTGGGAWERLTAVKLIRTGLATYASHPHSFGVQVGIVVDGNVTGMLIDGASLVLGNFPQGVPFLPLNPAEDMQRCERFYEGGASWMFQGISGVSLSQNRQTWQIDFKTLKSAAATVTGTPSGGNGTWDGIIGGANQTHFRTGFTNIVGNDAGGTVTWTAEVT